MSAPRPPECVAAITKVSNCEPFREREMCIVDFPMSRPNDTNNTMRTTMMPAKRRTRLSEPPQDTAAPELPYCPGCGSCNVVPIEAHEKNWTSFACIKCGRGWSPSSVK